MRVRLGGHVVQGRVAEHVLVGCLQGAHAEQAQRSVRERRHTEARLNAHPRTSGMLTRARAWCTQLQGAPARQTVRSVPGMRCPAWRAGWAGPTSSVSGLPHSSHSITVRGRLGSAQAGGSRNSKFRDRGDQGLNHSGQAARPPDLRTHPKRFQPPPGRTAHDVKPPSLSIPLILIDWLISPPLP